MTDIDNSKVSELVNTIDRLSQSDVIGTRFMANGQGFYHRQSLL